MYAHRLFEPLATPPVSVADRSESASSVGTGVIWLSQSCETSVFDGHEQDGMHMADGQRCLFQGHMRQAIGQLI